MDVTKVSLQQADWYPERQPTSSEPTSSSKSLQLGLHLPGVVSSIISLWPEGGNIDYYSVDHNIEGHVGSADLQNGDAFSDTDYATDPRDRKSILGFVFLVYGGAAMTYSKKMKSVARSTTEAEYVGMGEPQKLHSGDVDCLQS
ncbi:hypothetical protein NOR_07486 [Metarhizium rileyi]|uniref:Uncharacterized protein n=1 Tax=Metarhizium rileyi (strain RCEF 4871) TaxID=1649241 RepID=A0A166YA37_METRR|nr:hypothetical protein NOR_07486 [Metarhizium rileyi RCEF 4871]